MSPAQINGRSLPVRQALIESQQRKGDVAVGGALQEQVKDLQSDLARDRVQVTSSSCTVSKRERVL